MGGIKKTIWHEGGRIDEYCYLDKWSEITAETDMQSNYAMEQIVKIENLLNGGAYQ